MIKIEALFDIVRWSCLLEIIAINQKVYFQAPRLVLDSMKDCKRKSLNRIRITRHVLLW